MPSGQAWGDYVAGFHRDRPGVTEELLGRCADHNGVDPHEWVAEALGPAGLVIDLACGSGPLQPLHPGWLGVDISMAELGRAAEQGRLPVVAGTAEALPLGDGSVDGAVAAMALMVVDDPTAALTELARVLRPSSLLTVLVPSDRPLGVGDRVRYVSLLAVLGRTTLAFPRPEVVNDPRVVVEQAGFEVVDDERRRFGFTLGDRSAGDLLVESLYLPGVGRRRLALAKAVVRAWGKVEIGIPLHRLVARLPPRPVVGSEPPATASLR